MIGQRMRLFDDITVNPVVLGDVVYFVVKDTELDMILARGSRRTIQVHFFDPDCAFCDRLADRSFGLCDGSCGAPIAML